MTKSRIVACLALALCMQVSATATAQDMSFDLEETESAGGKAEAGKKGGKKAEPKTAAPAEPENDTGEETGAAEEGAPEAEAEGAGGLIGDLASDDPNEPKEAVEGGPKPTEVSEEIYAVQQVYALRNNRIELIPSFGY